MFNNKKFIACVLAAAFTLGVSGCAAADEAQNGYMSKTETLEAGQSAVSIVTRPAETIRYGSEAAIIDDLSSAAKAEATSVRIIKGLLLFGLCGWLLPLATPAF